MRQPRSVTGSLIAAILLLFADVAICWLVPDYLCSWVSPICHIRSGGAY